MKNKVENKATIIFILFLIVVAIITVARLFLSASKNSTYEIYTKESVSGLIVDSPVEFHGVDVGLVKKIELIEPHLVRILLTINKRTPVSQATVATIISRGLASRGFTGYVYISLEDVNSNFKPLMTELGESYPTIATMPSQLNNLDTSFSQINKSLQAISTLLLNILDNKTIASFKKLINNLQIVTTILANNNKKLNTIVINTASASSEFVPFLKSGNHTLKMLQTQILPEAYDSLSNLNDLSNSLKNVVSKINHDPSVLIRGTKPSTPGPGENK